MTSGMPTRSPRASCCGVTGFERSAREPRRYLIAKKRIRKQIRAVKKTAIAERVEVDRVHPTGDGRGPVGK